MPTAKTPEYGCPHCQDTGIVVMPVTRRGTSFTYGHGSGCNCYWCRSVASNGLRALLTDDGSPGGIRDSQNTWCRDCEAGQGYREWIRAAHFYRAGVDAAPHPYVASVGYHRMTQEEAKGIRKAVAKFKVPDMPDNYAGTTLYDGGA